MLKRNTTDNGERDDSQSLVLKKVKFDEDKNSALVVKLDGANSISALSLIPSNFQHNCRRSNLQAPNMQLSGHSEAVFSMSFDSSGTSLCSGSADSKILLWDVYGECKNYNVLTGHRNAVLEVKWIHGSSHIVSCSADKTAAIWDANKGVRIRKYVDHSGIVNSCNVAAQYPTLFCSGSDDCTAVIWDTRNKHSVQSFYHDYQVTAVCMSLDGQMVYTGGIDNIIRRWDIRLTSSEPDLIMNGHTDTVTGLSISPDGNFLLSNAMDATVRSWDVRPFVINESNRCDKVFQGSTHGAEKNLLRCNWSPDQNMVTCGSANRAVQIWDAVTTKLLYCLGGHKGSVNDAIFHPSEPIIASCGTDKQIFMGELGDVNL